MYRDGSDTPPPPNADAAKCEICAESVRPGDGFVTESRLGWAGRVWTKVMCRACFSHNYPRSAALRELQERRAQRCETCGECQPVNDSCWWTDKAHYCDLHNTFEDYPRGVELDDGCGWWEAIESED